MVRVGGGRGLELEPVDVARAYAQAKKLLGAAQGAQVGHDAVVPIVVILEPVRIDGTGGRLDVQVVTRQPAVVRGDAQEIRAKSDIDQRDELAGGGAAKMLGLHQRLLAAR